MKKRILAFALTVLYRIEGAIKSAQLDQSIRERNERNSWFVGALVLVCLTVPACVGRMISAETVRCDRAMNAAAEVSEQAIRDEAARCRANLERIRR